MDGRSGTRKLVSAVLVMVLGALVFAAPTFADQVTRYDDRDPAIVYQPSVSTVSTTDWYRWPEPPNNTNYYEGGYTNARNADRLATFTFTGTGIDWITVMASNQGLAEVWVNSEAPVVVDLYSATAQYQQVVWSRRGLPDGTHTLTIRALGTNRAGASAGTSTLVGIDAFDVITPDPPVVSTSASSPWSLSLGVLLAGAFVAVLARRRTA